MQIVGWFFGSITGLIALAILALTAIAIVWIVMVKPNFQNTEVEYLAIGNHLDVAKGRARNRFAGSADKVPDPRLLSESVALGVQRAVGYDLEKGRIPTMDPRQLEAWIRQDQDHR